MVNKNKTNFARVHLNHSFTAKTLFFGTLKSNRKMSATIFLSGRTHQPFADGWTLGPPHSARSQNCQNMDVDPVRYPGATFLYCGDDFQTITRRLWTQNQYSRWIEKSILSKSIQKSKSYVDFKSRFF